MRRDDRRFKGVKGCWKFSKVLEVQKVLKVQEVLQVRGVRRR